MSYETRGTQLQGFDPYAWASKIQAGAEKLATNIQRIGGRVSTAQQRVNTVVDSVTRGANTGAEVVRATTRAGLATAATGDATSGLAAASLTTRPALIIGGMIAAIWVFTRHPGHRRY